MSFVVAGSGGTIKSETAEGQLLEILNFLRLQEKISDKNPQGVNNVEGSFSIVSDGFSGSFDLPISFSLNSSGQPIISVPEYLTGVSFIPGNGGTFKSNTAAGYFVEVIMYMQALEATTLKNPQARNYVTGTFSSDNSRFVGTIFVPTTVSLSSDGHACFVAQEYLLA